jgi:hypothetical protein
VIVVIFQSWLDPFIIITALPGALAGIIWSLFLTNTTLSVPALTGSIMCMGTGTANSILVVSFAREEYSSPGDAVCAAVAAGYARLQPVMMTALATIIGMLPMSMSNTQNAPLGRAVIGGLLVATFATPRSHRGVERPRPDSIKAGVLRGRDEGDEWRHAGIGSRDPKAARAARIANSHASQSSVGRNISRFACTPSHFATATFRENAIIDGRCRTACGQWR